MYIENIAVLSFYSFVNIDSIGILQSKMLLIGKRKYVRGTILLAREGFNGSLSGSKENVDLVLNELTSLTGAQDVNIKVNYCAEHPFLKLKVKLKREIITMGVPDLDVNALKGDYIETSAWDDFIKRDDVVLVDTRNDYEVELGTFKGAVDPKTDTFKDFPVWAAANKEAFRGKKIAMCCTGGVRCEKSTALMRTLGFDEVYHLRGGILQYLEDTGNKNQLWQGECFVFDERDAVDETLRPANLG